MMKWEFEVRFKGLQALWKDQSSVNVAGLSKLHESCTLDESFYSPAGERLILKSSVHQPFGALLNSETQ